MSPFDLAAALLLVAAILGFFNDRWIGLPHSIGLLAGTLSVSLVILALDPLVPHHLLTGFARDALAAIDLPRVLLDGVLAFLLFAASLHVSLDDLRTNKWTILALATVGVILSTVLFGGLIWAVFQAGSAPVPIRWCLVLGAILAPTDAVVVDGLLRRVELPAALKAAISGESLFNDGVAVVIFLVALASAEGATGLLGHGVIAARLLVESAGGAAIGIATGFCAAAAIRRSAHYNVELTISLALVLVTYRLAQAAGVSGPISVVAAGLLVGRQVHGTGTRRPGPAQSGSTDIVAFWSVVDELLNALLFVLIGFEVLGIALTRVELVPTLAAIPLSLLARAVSVSVPLLLMRLRLGDRGRGVAVLTWAGLRGGVSVALALTLPPTPYRAPLLTVCYAVVIFSIIVQGLTMPRFIRWIATAGPRT